jgi:hypothetical protein
MTDDRVETHVTIADPEALGSRRAVHFQSIGYGSMPVPMRWPSPSSASMRRGPHPALSRPSRTLI